MRSLILLVAVGCAHEPIGERRVEHAEVPVEPRPTPPAETHELAKERLFAIGGVGFAGEPNPGEQLTLTIARQPDAIAVFERLAVVENRVARLYAYWALRTLAPARAATYEASLRTDTTKVMTMSGCIGADLETRKVLATIEQRPMPAP